MLKELVNKLRAEAKGEPFLKRAQRLLGTLKEKLDFRTRLKPFLETLEETETHRVIKALKVCPWPVIVLSTALQAVWLFWELGRVGSYRVHEATLPTWLGYLGKSYVEK